MYRFFLLAASAAVALAANASAQESQSQWRVTLEPASPMRAAMVFDATLSSADNNYELRSISGLSNETFDAIGRSPDQAFFTLRGQCTDGVCAGATGRAEAPTTFSVSAESLTAAIDSGWYAGTLNAEPLSEDAPPIRDYAAAAEGVLTALQAGVYNPEHLSGESYEAFTQTLHRLGAEATNDLDFLSGFRALWREADLFSHVELSRPPGPVAAMLSMFDTMEVGYEAARLERRDDGVAVLTVDTMMGVDTIAQIDAAFTALADDPASALIIDLRGNNGGAFAVRPLVEHVIDEGMDAGAFLSRGWWADNDTPPSDTEREAVPAWDGWSVSRFWSDVQAESVVRVRFEPDAEHNFDGPIYVLIDGDTFSAAELAADALRASGVAVLVGETTGGQMLSQMPVDIAEGFALALPIADYYSAAHGRIEGEGVAPHVEAPADDALDAALAHLAARE